MPTEADHPTRPDERCRLSVQLQACTRWLLSTTARWSNTSTIHRCLPSPPRRASSPNLYIDADGYIPPVKPGLGLELDEDRLHAATVVVTV